MINRAGIVRRKGEVMLLLRLIKRNMLVYCRDRSNIFFSLLSMLIIIGLMVVFLGKNNADSIINLLNQYGGERDTAVDRANAEQLVMLWTLAGIVVVNAVTITFTMVGIMVEDEAQKRLSSFYVSPVNRAVFVMGYVIAAIVMGIIMCGLTVIIGETYIGFTGGTIISFAMAGKVLLFIIINVFTSASMVFLLANFVHSLSALSGLGTIIGTLVGFVAGIYLPIGSLPEKVQTVLKCFPLLHGCSFLRDTFTGQVLADTFSNCPPQLIDEYKQYMGITILFDGNEISGVLSMSFLVISGIILLAIAAFMQRRRNVMSR
jgi:multidrug/hemolysin transport system permease protein